MKRLPPLPTSAGHAWSTMACFRSSKATSVVRPSTRVRRRPPQPSRRKLQREASVGSRTADISAARAAVDAQLANVRRLEEMQSFERVLAPFDGVVTERRIEKGDLVSAGSGGDRNLFSVAQSKTLRIQVSVPQNYAVDLHTGQDAEVTVRERSGEIFHGKVARTAESIATATRTLLDGSAGGQLFWPAAARHVCGGEVHVAA